MGRHASVEKRGPGLAKLKHLVDALQINPEVKVGVLSNEGLVTRGPPTADDAASAAIDALYDSGGSKPQLSNVDIAIINEYGTPTIPARPFIGTSGDHFKDAWLKLMTRTLGLVVDEKISVDEALEIVGQRAAADMRHVLLTASWEPNAPRTIEKKGSSRPLVDTRQLVNSISHSVNAHATK